MRDATGQGHEDGSCRARGRAWAIHGFALGHATRASPRSRRCADHFPARLPDDRVACRDLVSSGGRGRGAELLGRAPRPDWRGPW
ncbi:hypothetical protein ACIGNX_02160 [Actinosynnema sp. NPDC053489]|uniref:hypothetical protein n=1 Tax=Actinosynnema sp. NPDC053489 TaxID=3363916 RepID=UPI0037CAEB7A